MLVSPKSRWEDRLRHHYLLGRAGSKPLWLAASRSSLLYSAMAGPRDQDFAEVLSKLHAQLGEELLSALLGVTTNEVHARVVEENPPLAEIAARAAYLMNLLQHLSGTHNYYGIQRWFHRKRAQLGGRSPLEYLLSRVDWTPDDEAAIEVAMLARAIFYMVAT